MNDNNDNLISCPSWHRPLFRIVKDGIEIKCKFCGGAIHQISRKEIEQYWDNTQENIPTPLDNDGKTMVKYHHGQRYTQDYHLSAFGIGRGVKTEGKRKQEII